MHDPLEIRLSARSRCLRAVRSRTWAARSVKRCWRCLRFGTAVVVAADALVDGLWGEELPASPRNALHHHVARLRAALGERSIVGAPDGYELKDARVDALRFEELLAETRDALRDGDVRPAADSVASALDLRGAALRSALDGVVQRRGHAGSRRCTSTRSRRTSRSRPRSVSIAS